MASDTEITKVRIVIRHLLWQIREIRKDRDAAWQWVNRFANTLQYQDLEQDPDQYALAILAEARSFNDQKKRNQQVRWVREQLAKEGVTSPTQEQLDEKWLEMYGQETTADGDTREDSHDEKSGTSANHYDQEASPAGAGVNLDSTHTTTTPCMISADGPRQAEARQSQRAGGNSLRVAKVSTPPVRSAGPMPEDKQAVYDFAAAEGLDTADARDWFEMTVVERDGNDRNGKPIVNWKGACKRFCTARAKARNKDGENQ